MFEYALSFLDLNTHDLSLVVADALVHYALMNHLNVVSCKNDSEDSICDVGPDVNRPLFDVPIILNQKNNEYQDDKHKGLFEL